MVAQTPASPAVAPARAAAVYPTPANFEAILNYAYSPAALVPAAALTPRTRFLLSSPDRNYLSIGADGAAPATTAFTTYRDSLAKTVEAVPETSDPTQFRFDSDLHNLYSLDADASAGYRLVWRNNWGTASAPANRGYVTFRYDPATKRLQAVARQAYNLGDYSHSADKTFGAANWYVRFDGSLFVLVSSASQATPISLSKAPINADIPADFNADQSSFMPNPRVPVKEFARNSRSEIEGDRSKVLQDLAEVYRPQVAAVGPNAGTQAAAEAMLATIKKTVEAEGGRLRYSPELYLAFRTAALKVTLQSDSIANGTLGQPTSPFVYFTNGADAKGVHHPFLCIASYTISDKPLRLMDVTRPPGDGEGQGYANQNVTRDATLGLNLTRIPLRDYGLVATLADNKMAATIKSDEKSTLPDSVYINASISGVGIAVDGVMIYPLMSNMLVSCQEKGEITSTGIHVGQGMGLHWHSDGHTANANDLQLYNLADYAGQTHPPLIGFGLDGVALYGTYEAAYGSMEGINVPLDAWGGHSHGVWGYHYHAHQVTSQSSEGNSYTNHVLIKGAWRGLINEIPDFWETRKSQPNYSLAQRTNWAGKK